jgi:hypothetical protein
MILRQELAANFGLFSAVYNEAERGNGENLAEKSYSQPSILRQVDVGGELKNHAQSMQRKVQNQAWFYNSLPTSTCLFTPHWNGLFPDIGMIL